jgi:hypothetical protein
VFETLKAEEDRLDLVPKLMGERADETLASFNDQLLESIAWKSVRPKKDSGNSGN